jgi:DNA-3-methyladenine glycosylase I
VETTASSPALASLQRCAWAGDGAGDVLMTRYHDSEWGVPIEHDVALFERLALESFQAGLSWQTILHKREAFRRAFRGFEPAVVAGFGRADVDRLLADAGIVRNRAKVEATIANARAFIELSGTDRGFATYLDDFAPPPPPRLPTSAVGPADIPVTTPAAEALSRDLKARGFRFVGPTIAYAFLQSVGRVDDHLPGCFRYLG